MAEIINMPPTMQERYRHFRDNAEAFIESMLTMIAAFERDGDIERASQLKVWCLNPWEAVLRDDDAGDLWFTCEICEKPIKDHPIGGEDGCWFHSSCLRC